MTNYEFKTPVTYMTVEEVNFSMVADLARLTGREVLAFEKTRRNTGERSDVMEVKLAPISPTYNSDTIFIRKGGGILIFPRGAVQVLEKATPLFDYFADMVAMGEACDA